MKRILSLALAFFLASMIGAIAEEAGEAWRLTYYVDEFRMPTGEAYVSNAEPIVGIFSNSATTDSALEVVMLLDEDGMAFLLYEYGNNLVKNAGNAVKDYNVTTRDPAGNKMKLVGTIAPGSDRIRFDSDATTFIVTSLKAFPSFSFYIEEADRPTTNYLFTISNTSGFNAAVDELDGMAKERDYEAAVALYEAGSYREALAAFSALGDYKDSAEWPEKYQAMKYEEAEALLAEKKYSEANDAFIEAGDYRDAGDRVGEPIYVQAEDALEEGRKAEAAIAFAAIAEYRDARERSMAIWDEIAERSTLSAGNGFTVGVKVDGTVVAVGDNSQNQCSVEGWRDIIAVSAPVSGAHTVGLKSDGTVVAVGWNKYGQCNISAWKDIVAIATGLTHTIGLRMDGTVVAVGDNMEGACDVKDWRNIVAIATNASHTLGLKTDGTVVTSSDYWGDQRDVEEWTGINAIAYGGASWIDNKIGLKADGTMVAAGYTKGGKEDYGQSSLEAWSQVASVSAGFYHTVGLKADGTVIAAGNNKNGECKVSQWTDIVAVSAGMDHTVALKADGTVVCTGKNDRGQCKASQWTDLLVPVAARKTGANDLESSDQIDADAGADEENNPDTPVYEPLSKGAKGEDVKRLQQALIDAGALTGNADGDFGKMTAAAVTELQREWGLEETGIADSDFQKRLYGE